MLAAGRRSSRYRGGRRRSDRSRRRYWDVRGESFIRWSAELEGILDFVKQCLVPKIEIAEITRRGRQRELRIVRANAT
jgi:hypothetical protein